MTAPLSVLYDLSSLAPVVDETAHYTGVQRVVKEVAAGLKKSSGVRLTLYGGKFLRACERFVAGDPHLRGSKFLRPFWDRGTRAVVERLERWSRWAPGKRLLYARAFRKLASVALRPVLRWQARLSDVQLTAHDIYHSPVFAFPPAVLRSTHLKKFLTVYDLTPLKMPQHSDAAILAEYHQMLASVPRDGYFLCISEHTKKDWCEHTGIAPERCFVTPLAAGVHLAPCHDGDRLEQVRGKYGLPSGSYFLSVSTLEPRKNLPLVIRAFVELVRQTQDNSLYLVLAGRRGWQEDKILQLATDSPAAQKIIFTGYVAEEDLAALYSGALAFLYMSFYEGFGLPPLEAMQCGVPTVTSNTSSLPEVVGLAGIMLDPHDQDGLCAVMRRLRDDPALRADLSERALKQAGLFTWQQCVDRTIAAYRAGMAQG